MGRFNIQTTALAFIVAWVVPPVLADELEPSIIDLGCPYESMPVGVK
jgi:hypothetical protein